MDSVPSFTGASVPPPPELPSTTPGLPALFAANVFAAPPLFMSSRDSSGVGGSSEAVPFTAEDRMMLKMLYHQQQAINVQLSTLTTWMQHLGTLLAGLERHTREHQMQEPGSALRPQSSSDVGGAAPTTTAAPRGGATVAEGTGKPLPPQASAATPPPAAVSSTTSQSAADAEGRAHNPTHQSQLEVGHPAGEATTLSKGSGAYTPPVAGTGSGNSSAVNRSRESALAVWDPTNRRPSRDSSSTRSSRGGSQLGRQENPLLAAMSLAAAMRPTIASRVNSSLDHSSNTSGLSSRYLKDDPGRARSQPVIARPQSSPAKPGVASATSMARAFGERDIPTFRHVGRDPRIQAAATGLTVDPIVTSTLLNRGTRTLTRTAQQQHQQAPVGEPRPGDTQQQRSPVSRTTGVPATTTTTTTAASTFPVHYHSAEGKPSGSGSGSGRGSGRVRRPAHITEAGRQPQHRDVAMYHLDVELETDSLSDGYGSYDSRQYMKSVGLL